MIDIDSPVAQAIAERFHADVAPVSLPVRKHTWKSLKLMGVNLDAGRYEFLQEGTHISTSFFQHWGWWKTQVLGFYPYTDLRDYEAHENQGIGRPWLRLLPEVWQELIFRELVLLIWAWNTQVVSSAEFGFERDEPLPPWMQRWLSLTNESWRRGAAELEQQLYASLSNPEERPEARVAGVVQAYQASALTWRPMMPERSEFHRKYRDRAAYWTFNRVEYYP